MQAKIVKLSSDNISDIEIEQIQCCGIFEIEGLKDEPWEVIYALCDSLKRDYEMIIFHDAIRYRCGDKLAKLIRKYKLGKLHASKVVYNPNSTNKIQMWIFYPNWEVIRPIIATSKDIESICECDDWSCDCEISEYEYDLQITLPTKTPKKK